MLKKKKDWDLNSLEETIKNFFFQKLQVLSVDLFGSFAENRATEQSDVDIAIFCDPTNIPLGLELIDWREQLSDILKKEVDLVCLNTVSPIIGMQVDQKRKNIFVKNNLQYSQYQMRLFSDYAELKELRAPMEKQILKRKYYD